MIKNILGRLFTVWGGIVFIGSMLVFMPAVWISGMFAEPQSTGIFIRICRSWMAIFFTLSGVRLTIRGRENFKKGENYIVVCNHNSLMDVPLTSPGIPGANKTIAKIEMAKIPVFGIIYKRGSVLLDRKSDASRRDSYLAMKDVLEKGMHMCIYPEGTRNKTENPLKSFHDGAFRLSFDTGKKIIPCLIKGTREMLPHNKSFFFWPGKASMQFLPAIDPKDFASAAEMKEHVFQLMWDGIAVMKN
ncbi:MAG: lysophospholipid acyltransferase family protein [bacterium]|jgi:1-acyl-sn-glycerol-3-phosphate acyltransferase